ncbi:MAG: response regulator [Bacteroidetes bacterium]|nr:MAG: response regulator [Bacteroidota bacterium]
MSRVLVIDDEPYILLMLKKLFEKEGFEVDIAINGDEGIRMFAKYPADVIITDIVMPEKEGLETIREFKQTNPDLKIIAISGGGRIDSKEYLDSARLFGASKVFRKPFKQREMVNAVHELLSE